MPKGPAFGLIHHSEHMGMDGRNMQNAHHRHQLFLIFPSALNIHNPRECEWTSGSPLVFEV